MEQNPKPPIWTEDQLATIIKQAEAADYVRITCDDPDISAETMKLRFRSYPNKGGGIRIQDFMLGEEISYCAYEQTDLQRMKVCGNKLTLRCHDDELDNQGNLIEANKYNLYIELFSHSPLKIQP